VTGRARDRDVLLLMSGVVVVVLAANLLSAAVPGLDVALARAPILVLVLVAGTALVLAGALRRPRR
jgi:hypothetical protein